MPDLYKSKAWLTKRYKRDGKTVTDIAKECKVTEMTIWRWLVKHGLADNRRTW